MTPRSKHYSIKYQWFWGHTGPRNIQLVKISSEDQLGDLFTNLSGIKFSWLRKTLMGWQSMVALSRGSVADMGQYDYPIPPDKFVIIVIGHTVHGMTHLPPSY